MNEMNEEGNIGKEWEEEWYERGRIDDGMRREGIDWDWKRGNIEEQIRR